MQKELYFDINTPQSGGSLFKVTREKGDFFFIYNHSTYNDDTGEVKVFEKLFGNFALFWQQLITDPEWFYQHPLYVHPEQRAFIREQLKKVSWQVQPNKKWQESHQRQWKKVLTDPDEYYKKQE